MNFRVAPILASLLFFAAASAAAQPRAERLRIVYSAIGSSQSPLWIAHEAGLFKKHGLDAEILYVAGGSRAAQVILSGEAPIVMFNGSAVVSADVAGADLVNIASGMNNLIESSGIMPAFATENAKVVSANAASPKGAGSAKGGCH